MPREANTVIAPKPSGMAAATGERKTSEQDDQQDRYRDQLTALAGGDRLDPEAPREMLAKPDWVARTGEWMFSLEDAVELGDGFVYRLVDVDVEVGQDQGLVRAGAQARHGAAGSTGESVVTLGSRRRARISAGPCSSSAAAGPRSRIAKGAELPKLLRQHFVGLRRRRSRDGERGRLAVLS